MENDGKETGKQDAGAGADNGGDDAVPDWHDLARRTMDLWQDQWAAMLNDPVSREASTRLFEMTGKNAQMMAMLTPGLAPAAFGAMTVPPQDAAATMDEQTDAGTTEQSGSTADAHATCPARGAAPAGHASGGDAVDIAVLLRRIADLEKRVADLERGSGRTGGQPEKGDRGSAGR